MSSQASSLEMSTRSGEYTQMTPRDLLQAEEAASDGDVDTDEVLERVSARNWHVRRRVLAAFVSVALVFAVLTVPHLRGASVAIAYEAGEQEQSNSAGSTISEFSLFGSGKNKKKKPPVNAGDAMLVHWRLGAEGESCDITCSKDAMGRPTRECHASTFKDVSTEAGFKRVANLTYPAGNNVKCKKMQKKASSGAAPQVYKSWTKGTTCMWGASAPTCGAVPDAGYQRMCPCKKVVHTLQWRIGGKDESCDTTCTSPKVSTLRAPLYCDEKALKGLNSKNEMEVTLNLVKTGRPKCSVKENSKLTSGPEYKKGMLSGTCSFSKNTATSSCATLPVIKGNTRICPCGPMEKPSQPWKLGTTLKPDPFVFTTPPIAPIAPIGAPGAKPPTAPPLAQKKTYWVLGAQLLDCLSVCKQRQATCEGALFRQVTSQGVYQLSTQLGSTCSMTWVNDGVHGKSFQNVPAQCLAATGCGVDPLGLCALPKAGQYASCTGTPPPGYARMCPCTGGSVTR